MEEALLTEDFYCIDIFDDASLVLLRSHCRQLAGKTGLSVAVTERILVVVSELGRNHLDHARNGAITVRAISSIEGSGVEIIATDQGRGLVHLQSLIEADKKYSYESLGSGVASIVRMADEVHFDIRQEEGCSIRARFFEQPQMLKVTTGIYGRPKTGESISGDHAGSKSMDKGHLFTVLDGLGHGSRARESSEILLSRFLGGTETDPFQILFDGSKSLNRKNVGATAAVAFFDKQNREFFLGRAGDVSAVVFNGRKTYRSLNQISPLAFSLQPRKVPASDRISLLGRECWLLMFSDGVSNFAADVSPAFFRELHPIVVAEKIMNEFDRGQDDSMVLVAHLSW